MQNRNVPGRAEVDYTGYEDLGRKWTSITILRLKSSLAKNNVGKTQKLLNSFTQSVNTGNGDYLKIIITYMYYGIFPDMGVGKGINIAKALTGGKFKRKRKVWYSKTIGQEISKLSFFMAKKAGNDAAKILLDFPTKVEI